MCIYIPIPYQWCWWFSLSDCLRAYISTCQSVCIFIYLYTCIYIPVLYQWFLNKASSDCLLDCTYIVTLSSAYLSSSIYLYIPVPYHWCWWLSLSDCLSVYLRARLLSFICLPINFPIYKYIFMFSNMIFRFSLFWLSICLYTRVY